MKTLLVVFTFSLTSALSFSTAQIGSSPADRQVYEDAIENHGLRGSADVSANMGADMDEATFGLMLMGYARLLFEAGEKDEAVFWHYAGQLRYRLYASQVPERGGEFFGDFPRLWEDFEALMAAGEDVNLYAYCDVPGYAATIGRVLEWHEATPYLDPPPEDRGKAISAEAFGAARSEVVAGLRDLQAYAAENADEIKAQRAANGVDEREVCR